MTFGGASNQDVVRGKHGLRVVRRSRYEQGTWRVVVVVDADVLAGRNGWGSVCCGCGVSAASLVELGLGNCREGREAKLGGMRRERMKGGGSSSHCH